MKMIARIALYLCIAVSLGGCAAFKNPEQTLKTVVEKAEEYLGIKIPFNDFPSLENYIGKKMTYSGFFSDYFYTPPPGLTPNPKSPEFHFIIHSAPELLVTAKKDDQWRISVWRIKVTGDPKYDAYFASLVYCKDGLPKPSEKKSCKQIYKGLKADGSESLELQKADPTAWDYQFNFKEQIALWRDIEIAGTASPYDMAAF